MKKLMLICLLGLASCAALEETVDHAADRTERLVTHTTQEIGKLKTETLKEVKDTVEEVVPRVVDQAVERILGDEAVAFLIVTFTGLLGLVVVVALILLLGTARAWWKRLRNRSSPPAANT